MDTLPLIAIPTFALWVFALARLTRLITKDEITDPLRIAVIGRFGPQSTPAYLSTCAWCMSVWLAAATGPFFIWLTEATWWMYPVVFLAGSHLVGLLAQLDNEEMDIDVED